MLDRRGRKQDNPPLVQKKRPQGLPTKEDIAAYLRDAPGETSRRDIARAFNVKGEDRFRLRAILKEMEAEGGLTRGGPKKYHVAGDLPEVLAIDVMSVDEDGDLVCLPSTWEGDSEPPMIKIALKEAAKQRPAPGVGDRLLARLKPAGDDGYDARIIKPIGRGAHRFLAVFRKTKFGGVAEPVERRARQTFSIDRKETKPQTAILSGSRPRRGAAADMAARASARSPAMSMTDTLSP